MPNSLSLNLAVLATKMWVWEQQKHGLLDEQAVQHQRIRACSGQSFCAHLSATSKQCSSPKHLCSSRELQGSPLHTFPSAFPVCLHCPRGAGSHSLRSKVQTHGWRQERLPALPAFPWEWCDSPPWSANAGALLSSTPADTRSPQKSEILST